MIDGTRQPDGGLDEQFERVVSKGLRVFQRREVVICGC
jgi:hypothetical protein